MDGKRKKKVSFIAFMVSVLAIICMGCQNRQLPQAETPEEAAELALEALQELDFQAFNQYTDNHVSTRRNWLGIPVKREYQMFQELQHPGLFRGKRYKANRKFAENVMEQLTWELVDTEFADLELTDTEPADTGITDTEFTDPGLTDPEVSGEKAWVTLRITNADFTDVMGYYVLHLMEQMTEGEGTGLKELFTSLSRISHMELGEVFGYMDEMQQQEPVTREVRLRAEKREGGWRLCLNEKFIQAVMGNMGSERFSPEIEEQLRELETEYEEKMERWGEELEEKAEKWAERWEEP